MRDLYNRPKKIAYWLNRIETDLHGQDKKDVLYFVKFMQDQERSALWNIRRITILIQLCRQLRKPFRDASEEDIRVLLRRLDSNDYRSSTIEKFRKVLKFFFKVVYGENRYYPGQVQWIWNWSS
jgi:site-specific recombinase XerD